MKLLTNDQKAQLPKLYSQDGNKNPMVYFKFFFPAGHWTWFITEGEQTEDDFLMFGYVIGDFPEWGYISLTELESINIRGLTVERDLYFRPAPFKEVLKSENFRVQTESK